MSRHAIALLTVVCLSIAQVSVAGELKGTVLRADGSPAAGATVWASAVFAKPPLRRRAAADDKGHFRLQLEPVSGQDEYWTVVARLGREGGEANDHYGGVDVPKEGDPAPVVIRLVDRGVVQGRLLQAEDDAPITGGKLFLDTGEILNTDEKGRFTAGGLLLSEHSLIAVAPGRVRRYFLFDTTLRPDAELDIRLERGAKLAGRVLDVEGKPIPGAYVARRGSGTALTLNGWDEACDAEGHFVYDGIFSARLLYSLEASAPGYEAQELRFPTLREEESTPEAIFHLKRKTVSGAPLPGNVKTAPARLPRRDLTGVVYSPRKETLPGAVIRWGATRFEGTSREVRSDAEGRFTLRDVPDRNGFITVIADRHAPRFERVNQGERQIDITLEEGKSTRGVVRSRTGKRLERVQVIPVLTSPDKSLCSPYWLRERLVVSDSQGRFEIRWLPSSGVRFDFVLPGWSELRNQTLEFGDVENVMELSTGGAVRGIVLDPFGKPVRDFRIRVQFPRRRQPNDKPTSFSAGYEWYGVSYTTTDGVFVISEVEVGSWLRLHAIAPGYGQGIVDRVQVSSIDELPPASALTLRLAPPHSLRVRVTDRGSKPLPAATVAIMDEQPSLDNGDFSWGYDDLWWLRRWTDKDGWAVFSNLEMGEGTVVLQCPGYERKRWGWRQGESEKTIALEREALVKGQITIGKRPLDQCWVGLRSTAGESYSCSIEDKDLGKYRIDQLPAGQYSLTVRDERRKLHEQRIELEAGESRELNLDVTDPDSDP